MVVVMVMITLMVIQFKKDELTKYVESGCFLRLAN